MDRKRLEDISEIKAGCLFSPVAVVCLPFLIIGAAMAVLSLHAAHDQALNNDASQRITVTITSSELGTVSTGRNSTRRVPLIEFAYSFDGQEHTSDRYFPIGDPKAHSGSSSIVERLPVGSTAQAWLPDGHQAPAFLEKHWNATVYAGVGAGLFAWSFCGLLLTVCGGWRWLGKAWLGAWVLFIGVLGIAMYTAWHAVSFVPRADLPVWLGVVGIGVGVCSLLPVFGAWQASRIATALREIES